MYYKNNYIVVRQIVVINQLVNLRVQDVYFYDFYDIYDCRFLYEKWIAMLSSNKNGHMWLPMAIY